MSIEGREPYLEIANSGLEKDQTFEISPELDAELRARTPNEVFLDHLEMRKHGRLEEDIARNYDENIVIVSNYGTFNGFDGVRDSAATLLKNLPALNYKFDSLLVNKSGAAFEEWTGSSDTTTVDDGIDAFIIKDGKIKIQTIYYTAKPNSEIH